MQCSQPLAANAVLPSPRPLRVGGGEERQSQRVEGNSREVVGARPRAHGDEAIGVGHRAKRTFDVYVDLPLGTEVELDPAGA